MLHLFAKEKLGVMLCAMNDKFGQVIIVVRFLIDIFSLNNSTDDNIALIFYELICLTSCKCRECVAGAKWRNNLPMKLVW